MLSREFCKNFSRQAFYRTTANDCFWSNTDDRSGNQDFWKYLASLLNIPWFEWNILQISFSVSECRLSKYNLEKLNHIHKPDFRKHTTQIQRQENYKPRSSHRRCSVRKSILRNFAKFTGKHLCQSFFFNKVAGLRPAILLKTRLWHSCFPVNFARFLRIPFFTEHFPVTASVGRLAESGISRSQVFSQLIFTCLKSTMETLEKAMKFVQS